MGKIVSRLKIIKNIYCIRNPIIFIRILLSSSWTKGSKDCRFLRVEKGREPSNNLLCPEQIIFGIDLLEEFHKTLSGLTGLSLDTYLHLINKYLYRNWLTYRLPSFCTKSNSVFYIIYCLFNSISLRIATFL